MNNLFYFFKKILYNKYIINNKKKGVIYNGYKYHYNIFIWSMFNNKLSLKKLSYSNNEYDFCNNLMEVLSSIKFLFYDIEYNSFNNFML